MGLSTGHTKEHDLGATDSHGESTSNEVNALISDGKFQTLYRGFDRRNLHTIGEPSYTVGTRTFAMAVISGQTEFLFYAGGTRYRKTTTQSVIFPDVTGTYYFYFDTSGVLQYVLNSALTSDIFYVSAICGLCYYNSTEGTLWNAIDEQHGVPPIGFTPADHLRDHLCQGFTWAQGGEISGLATLTSTFTGVSASLHFDEDLINSTDAITTMPSLYRIGTNGDWVSSQDDNAIAHMGTTYAMWNEDTGTTWQLTESTATTDYIIMFILKTNFNIPYFRLVGQEVFATRAAARDALGDSLRAIKLEGLPSTEAEFQFAYIAKRNGDLEDDGNGNSYIDLRGVRINSFV